MNADFDVQALYAALDAQRRARDIGWAQAAREMAAGPTKITAATLSKLCTRASVEGDGVLQMLLWLDRTPESFVHAHPLADLPTAQLRRVEADCILRFDTAALHAALDAKRHERGLTWTAVASEIGGIEAPSLTRLARGGRVGFPAILRVFAWLGEPVAAFTRASKT